jgi:membrane-associated phospholipid phosphatase
MAVCRHGYSWLSHQTDWCHAGRRQFSSSHPATAGALARAALLLSSPGDLAVAAVVQVA